MLFLPPLLRLLCRARSCLEVWSAAAWQGWRIEFSETFLQGLDSTSREHLLSGKAWSTSDGKGKPEVMRAGGCQTADSLIPVARLLLLTAGHRLARCCRGGARPIRQGQDVCAQQPDRVEAAVGQKGAPPA